jgi:Uma2 family endonuclease
MVSQLQSTADITYPESDGKPMADNTKQFRWIVVIQQNLDWLFGDRPDVFVAGDLLWYPIEGNNRIVTAPDVMVAFGRPKGDRGSYKQWEEAQIPPQVIFEILSPSNTQTEMERKLLFYDRHGVEEYYLYDPDTQDLRGWQRIEGYLDIIEPVANWTSPRLQIRFDCSGEALQLFHPDGSKFLSYAEIAEQAQQAQQRLEQAQQRAEQAQQRVEQAEMELERERQRSQALAERLRAAGIDPNEHD